MEFPKIYVDSALGITSKNITRVFAIGNDKIPVYVYFDLSLLPSTTMYIERADHKNYGPISAKSLLVGDDGYDANFNGFLFELDESIFIKKGAIQCSIRCILNSVVYNISFVIDNAYSARVYTSSFDTDEDIIADVVALQTSVDSQSNVIADNTTHITQNANAIASNDTDISNINVRLDNHDVELANNETRITQNESDIVDLQNSTAIINCEQIPINTTNIATNTANIATNTANIATNTANIATNTANIATNATNITTNTANIADNKTQINLNVAELADHETRISQNRNDIVNLSQTAVLGKRFIGQVQSSSAPSQNGLNDYETGLGYTTIIGDIVTWIQTIENETDKVFNCTYSSSGWVWFEFPIVEVARNTSYGIIKGSSNSDILVNILSGEITNIYVDNNVAISTSLKDYLNSLETKVTNIESGTTIVAKATADKNGNDIVDTYTTKSTTNGIDTRVAKLESNSTELELNLAFNNRPTANNFVIQEKSTANVLKIAGKTEIKYSANVFDIKTAILQVNNVVNVTNVVKTDNGFSMTNTAAGFIGVWIDFTTDARFDVNDVHFISFDILSDVDNYFQTGVGSYSVTANVPLTVQGEVSSNDHFNFYSTQPSNVTISNIMVTIDNTYPAYQPYRLGFLNSTPNKITSSSRNLLDKTKLSNTIHSFNIGHTWSDFIINAALAITINVQGSTSYIFSTYRTFDNYSIMFMQYDINRYCISNTSFISVAPFTFVTSSATRYVQIYFQFYTSISPIDVINEQFQFEQGSVATSYVEFANQQLQLPTQNVTLRGLSDTDYTKCDYVDLVNNKIIYNIGSRTYQENDENNSNVLTDLTTTYYILDTPITSIIENFDTTYLAYIFGKEVIVDKESNNLNCLSDIIYNADLDKQVVKNTDEIRNINDTLDTMYETQTINVSMSSVISGTNPYFDITGSGTLAVPYTITPKSSINHNKNIYVLSISEPAQDTYINAKGIQDFSGRCIVKYSHTSLFTTHHYYTKIYNFLGDIRPRIIYKSNGTLLISVDYFSTVETFDSLIDLNSTAIYYTTVNA